MSKPSDFEKVGLIYLSASKRSLKIEINDATRVFGDVYYVAVVDVQKALRQPGTVATIVKIKRPTEDNMSEGISNMHGE